MKKYSDKFLNDSNVLSKSKIGLEFEFFMKDLSYYKTLEIMNQIFSPVVVSGFRVYHPDFIPTASEWIITPDLSGGQNLLELITGPLDYYTAKIYLTKILKFIQDYGYTTDKCAIHYNISFNETADKNLNDINVLKLILNTNEDEIYRYYPSRKGNVYAKSVKKIIPYRDYDYNNVSIDVVKNSLRVPDDKYFGINFLHMNKSRDQQRLEFRYIGGKDYEKNIGQIMYFMDKFIMSTYNCIDIGFDDNDINDLEKYLDANISFFKNFAKYDSFLVEYPSITIQIDQDNTYDMVNAHYDKIYKKVFTIIDSVDDLKDCIINYVTSEQKIEVVDAQIKTNFNIKNYDFINCEVLDGIYENCTFHNCNINNSQMLKCKIDSTEVTKSKVLNCEVDNGTNIIDCFFMGGYLNSDMEGGIYRSGRLGPVGNISSTTKIVDETDNFFNTKFDDDQYDKKNDEGVIKTFKQ